MKNLVIALMISLYLGLTIYVSGSDFKNKYTSGHQRIYEPDLYVELNMNYPDKGAFITEYHLAYKLIICCNPTQNPFAWCDFSFNHPKCKIY